MTANQWIDWRQGRLALTIALGVCCLFSHPAGTGASLAAPASDRPGVACSDATAFGAPRHAPADLYLLCQRSSRGESLFLVGYDRGRRLPAWAAYRVTRARVIAGARSALVRGGRRFRADPALDGAATRSPRPDDFRALVGFDRGHLAPAATMKWHREAYAASFLVTNMAAQRATLNRGPWRRLEAAVRAWACDLGTLYVITGVLPAAGQPAGADPAVPSHFYKLIYSPAEGGRAIAFLLANQGRPPLRAGIRSVDQLEAVSGLDFFPALAGPAQRALEAAVPDPAAWPLDRSARAACGLT